MQERGESVRESTADGSRRLQRLEGDVGRIETLLDVVRDEATAIRAGQSELKVLFTTHQSSTSPARGCSYLNITPVKCSFTFS